MNKIERCFDKAANAYDQNALLQLSVGKQLIALAQKYHPCAKRIMDLGCGTGLVTEKLATTFSWKEFHAIDLSTHSLNKANLRLSALGLNVYQANFDTVTNPANHFDVMFSNLALHWSSQLNSTLKQITKLLHDDGILAFSLPLTGTFIELQGRFSLHPFMTLSHIKNMLTDGGLNLLCGYQDNVVILFNDLVSALRSIKVVGTNHVEKRLHRTLQGKSFIKQIELNQLTYVIGYVVASKTSK